MFRNRSIPRRRKAPLRGGLRTRIDRRQASACFEWLEARQMLASASWVGGTTGYWDVAANWSNDAVPTSTTAVSIATGGATVTIQPGDTASASSLTIAAGDTLSMPAGVDSTNPTTNWIVDSDFESPDAARRSLWTWGSPVFSQHPICLHRIAIARLERGEFDGRRGVRGNARQLVHDIGLRDDPESADRQRDGLLEFVLLQLVEHPDQLLRRAPNSIAILTASSATGGPLAGSVGNQGWNHFYTTAVAPSGTAYVEAQVETYAGRRGHRRSTSTISNLDRPRRAPKVLPTSRRRQYFQ